MEKVIKLMKAIGKTLLVLSILAIFWIGIIVIGRLFPIPIYIIGIIIVIALIYKFYKEG